LLRLSKRISPWLNAQKLEFSDRPFYLRAQGRRNNESIGDIAQHQRLKDNNADFVAPLGLMGQGVTSNLILSQKRADNVMQYMISQGVNPNLVSAQGFGDADPVASNATPEGKAQNRRVELTLANSGS